MKKKSNGMSPDMFHDAMSSTPIPVFTTANEVDKNELQNPLQNVTEDFTGVKKLTPVNLQAEIIKVNFDKQTVSARALYDFFGGVERFSAWWTRMVSYGLEENVDFTTVGFHTVVNQGGTKEIGDYLLTIDAAKNIAMVQRSEKGKQARQYFINVEKMYLKSVVANNQKPETSNSLVENFKKLLVQLETEIIQNQQVKKDYDYLVEKIVVLEKQITQHHDLKNWKGKYIERTFSQKVDRALKETFTEADRIMETEFFAEPLSRIANSRNPIAPTHPKWNTEGNFHQTSLEEDLIPRYYQPAYRKVENALFLTATEITLHLEKFNKRVTVQAVGRSLKKLGFERVPHSKKGGREKGYFVIQL
jgi:phage anti-repressor protein